MAARRCPHGEVERVARPLLARTADPDRAAAQVAWLLAYSLARTGRPAEAAAVAEAALARPGISEIWAARLAIIMNVLGQRDRGAPPGETRRPADSGSRGPWPYPAPLSSSRWRR
jgi:hypothetical protein